MDLPRVAILSLLCGCVFTASPLAANGADDPLEQQGDAAPAARSIADARRQVDAARAEVRRLRGTIARKKRQLEASLNVSPSYRAALAERNGAKAAYEAARRPAVAKVHGKEQYQALLRSMADAKRSLAAAARTARVGAGDTIKLMSNDAREAAAAVAAMEAEAAAADPAACDAKAALDAAGEQLAALRAKYVDSALEADPACSAARERLASAEARLDAAGAELKRLRNAAAEADDALASAGPGDATSSASLGGRPALLPLRSGNGSWTRAPVGPVSRPLCIGGA